jgi:UDP-N-acetylmuramyl pentapeptide phosphotransferase/UDP-N-acetylglucosamine-1-phosphate transferase
VTGVLVLAGTALASALIVRAVRDFAHRRALLDLPNDRSSHDVPKPRLGGIGVVVPVLGVGVGLVVLGQAPPALLVPLAATGLVAVLGVVDDLRPLPARVRFGVQVVLASAVVAASWNRLPAAAGALGAYLPAPILAVLAVVWITWLTNLYNFMDGIDGLAGAQAVIASLGLAAVAASAAAGPAGWLLLALAGASAGFLAFNFPPSSIFLGDVGSTAMGFLVGVVPLLPGAGTVPIEPVALALSLFVLDATWTLLRRVARGERWYTPHRTHLYQRPVVKGAGHRSVLLVAAAGMVLVAGCAVMWAGTSTQGRLGLASVPFVLFAAGHLAVRRLERKVTSATADRPKEA